MLERLFGARLKWSVFFYFYLFIFLSCVPAVPAVPAVPDRAVRVGAWA